MKKKIVLFVFLASFISNAYGQKEFKSLMKQAHKALNNGQYTQTIKLSKRMRRVDDSDFRSYYYEGLAKFFLSDYEQAITSLHKAISCVECIAESRIPYYMGLSFYNLGEYDSSISYFKWAIALNPKDVDYYVDLADSFYELDSDSCLYYYDIAITSKPKYGYPYLMKAKYFYFNDKFQESLPYFNKAIKLTKEANDAIYLRSFAKYMIDDHNGAIADIKKAISQDPDDVEKYYYLSEYYMDIDDYSNAIPVLKSALVIDPGHAEALLNMAFSLYRIDHYPEALRHINKAIAANPDNKNIYRIRGHILYDMADEEGACMDWAVAAGKGSEDARELVVDYCKMYLVDNIK
jgi:tetratricopeptide (TPR) repeat protein